MKIGDQVKVIYRGAMYSSHEEMAKILGATKWVAGYHEDCLGRIGVIKNMKEQLIYGAHKHWMLVDLGDYEIVIGDNGITPVSEWDP